MTEYNDTPASKTRRKQDMQALQEVGLTLMGLKPEQRARLPLNPRDPRVSTVCDEPNPGKEILRALVVKASRTRPASDR